MAVLIIYSAYNRKVTEKVLTPENTHTKGNVNIYNNEKAENKKNLKKGFR